MPRFELQPVGESFFATAPKVYRETFEIAQPASQVWAELVAEGTLGFCRMLSGGKWTSPPPFAVGTTRTMKAAGAIVLHEKFFNWDDGRRCSFYVERCNLPLFKRFAEDYVVDETGPSSCRFTWTIACEPTAIGKPGSPINDALVRSLFADTRKHFGAS